MENPPSPPFAKGGIGSETPLCKRWAGENSSGLLRRNDAEIHPMASSHQMNSGKRKIYNKNNKTTCSFLC